MKPSVRLLAIVAFTSVLVLMLPQLATATVLPAAFFANIDDTTDLMLGSLSDQGYIPATNPFTVGGAYAFQSNVMGAITNEDTATFGAVDIHAEYIDSTPLAPGTATIVNFNIFEPEEPSIVSDTLSITFTGHVLGAGGTTNMSVDLHFLSDATDEALIMNPLPNGITVPENFDVSQLVGQATGLSNFHVQFASIPEPSTLVMLSFGIVSLFVNRMRKRVA